MNAFALCIVLPALVSAVVISLARRSRWSGPFTDHPNERSLHARPTPRLGGVGVMAGALPVLAVAGSVPLAAIAACALFLALLSLADDARSLPIEVRLPAHTLAAGIAVLAFASPLTGAAAWGWLECAIAILAIAWMTNLFNFMDGSDGLAGGMAIIGFGVLATAALDAGFAPLALACTALASAAAGFLAHNFPPARVFLGDCGAVPLGFLAGALGAWGIGLGAWPAWFPVLVFSPFIVDASVTIARRCLRGERIWIAHRTHFYQRLVLSGWSRTRLAITAYALMLAAGVSALATRAAPWQVQCAIIFAWSAIYLLVLVAIERRAASSGAAS